MTLLATNENRPGYKKTKIGWIPEEWECITLGDSCSVIMDGTHYSPKTKTGPFKYITSKNIKPGRLDLSECNFISEKEHNEIFSKCPVFYGQVLLTKDGAKAGSACINTLEEPFSLLSSVAVLDAKYRLVSNEFILCWLLSPMGQSIIFNAISGLAITRLTLQVIRTLPIVIPPLPEQKKIAEILSAWDRAVELLDRLITAKERLKKGLMQKLLTGKVRFPGFYDEWREVPIGQLIIEVDREVKWNDSKPYDLVSVRRRSGGLFHRGRMFGDQIKTKNLKEIKTGDFLISRMQIVHGASALVTDQFDGMYVSNSYHCLISRDSNVFSIKFFNFLSQMPFFYHLTYLASHGVHIEKMTFKLSDFMKFKIKVPVDVREQGKISSILNAANDEIKVLKNQLVQFKQQKKGLMQKLLTGTLRVIYNQRKDAEALK